MDLGLAGKVGIVAAASGGLGRAIATELAREGAKVAICSRDQDRVEAAAQAITEETGGEVLPWRTDVTKPEEIRAFVDAVVHQFGGIHILVTNAGGPPPGRFADVGEAEWYETFDLTFMSAVRLISACLPELRKSGWGRIIVMTSISVKQPIDNLILSNAVRLAVVGMARSLARDLAAERITVNIAAPGYIGTARTKELFAARAEREGRAAQEVEADLVRQIPTGRLGTPKEMAEMVAFLASERAAYLTGNVIQLDGGLYRGVL